MGRRTFWVERRRRHRRRQSDSRWLFRQRGLERRWFAGRQLELRRRPRRAAPDGSGKGSRSNAGVRAALEMTPPHRGRARPFRLPRWGQRRPLLHARLPLHPTRQPRPRPRLHQPLRQHRFLARLLAILEGHYSGYMGEGDDWGGTNRHFDPGGSGGSSGAPLNADPSDIGYSTQTSADPPPPENAQEDWAYNNPHYMPNTGQVWTPTTPAAPSPPSQASSRART